MSGSVVYLYMYIIEIFDISLFYIILLLVYLFLFLFLSLLLISLILLFIFRYFSSFVSDILCAFVYLSFFEFFAWDCHDSMDVVYNSLGFIIGYYLNKCYFENNDYTLTNAIYISMTVAFILIFIMFDKVKQYQKSIETYHATNTIENVT